MLETPSRNQPFKTVSGCIVAEKIHESPHTLVYRGRRQRDDLPVILKILHSEYPPSKDRLAFQKEYEITQSLEIEGVIGVYDLEKHGNTLSMLLEDVGALSLDLLIPKGTLSIKEILKTAAEVSAILARIHAAGVIHKGINPSNILYDRETGSVRIIDFGSATRLPHENPAIVSPYALGRDLAYISPEQTGRMARDLDWRTDFYSLGVTLYEMLTQQLPFDARDAMDLVYCHMAKEPIAPHAIDSRIPEVVSKIVMKLMAKAPEDRYQSALGIQSDLERCWRQLGETPVMINPFPLASYDISDRFQIPQKLYGREREVRLLMEAFERAGHDECELMLLHGPAGIGKTALVNKIHGPITQNRGYFISGKFDQYQRNVPYSAMIRAFQDLLRQLLTEDETSLSGWREKLLASLSPNAQVMIDVIPEVELITGPAEEVPDLPPVEAENRFNLVLQDFITVFAGREHPLVIFLDDLQWIDLASLNIVKWLTASPKIRHLLMIGAYRDNEVPGGHPLNLALEEIRKEGGSINLIGLSPLGFHEIQQLVGETLKCDTEAVRSLAEVVLAKTDGNPFSANTFLKSLYEEDLISFDYPQRQWQWSIEQIQEKQVVDNVVELLVGKINQFEAHTTNALMPAACLGNQFELETLAMVTGRSPGDTEESLNEAVSEGLVIETRTLKWDTSSLEEMEDFSTYQYSYSFSHDRIQQAAYALIPASEKDALHYKIGWLLLDQLSAEAREGKLFDIVGNLNKGIELFDDPSERETLARLNLQAARKARAAAAYEPAYNYFRCGMGLLGKDCWDKVYDLTLEIHVEAAEAAYLSADFDEMERLVRVVLQRAATPLDKVKAYEVKIQGCIARNQLLEATQTALRVMKLLGIKLPEKPRKAHVLLGFLRTRMTLLGKRVEDLVDLPEMKDPDKRAATRMLSIAGTAIYLSIPELMPLFVFKTVELSVKHGNSPESAIAYAGFGLVLCAIVGDIDLGYRFGNLAMKVMERFDSRSQEARTIFTINCFIRHWKEHARESSGPLMEAHKIGLQTGAFDHAILSAFTHVRDLLFIGKELTVIKQLAGSYRDPIAQLGQKTSFHQNDISHQVILNLMGEAENPCDLIGEVYDEEKMLPVHRKVNDGIALGLLYEYKSILCYMFGNYGQAVENMAMFVQHIDAAIGTMVIPVAYFYDSLARLAVLSETQKSERKSHLKKIAANQKKMKKWARHAPMNFLHKYYLVEAERDRVCGRGEKAGDLYDQAISLARENEYLNEEALANELAARFYLSKGKDKIARTYMQEAHYCYHIWGATAKIKDLQKNYPRLLVPYRSSGTAPASSSSVSLEAESAESGPFALDVTTVVKASQALSSEIALDTLMKKLMKILFENAGAQRGILILDSHGRLLIEARGTVDQDEVTVLESVPVEASEELPQAIINYTARSKAHVVINDAKEDSVFSKDPYIRSKLPKSILCAPIVHASRLFGIIYLENNLVTGAFTPKRLKVIELLSSQIAISIENARLLTARKEQTQRIKTANLKLEKEISERKAAEKKFRSIFENAVEGIFQISPEGRLLTVNPAFARIAGFDSPQALMNRISTLNSQFFVDDTVMNTLLTRLRKKGSVNNFEADIQQKDGGIISIMINVHAIQNESHHVDLYEGSIKDITETKRAAELQIAKDAAEAADKAKSAFLAHMSHEIRNPMSAIVGFTGLALNTNLSAKQRGYLDKIRSSSRALLAIMNDILDLSKMAAGKFSLDRVDFQLSEVMAYLADILSGQAAEKEVALTFSIANDVPDALRGDPARLQQVLVNLVHNGIKFTEKGEVKVAVSLIERSSSCFKLEFIVADTGIGIDEEKTEYLFEAFTQAEESPSRHKAGTGLGLAICKNLVDMMGGEIWANGKTGLGSTFGVSIAFDEVKAPLAGKAPEPMDQQEIGARLKGSRILLAEDDIMNQIVTAELLKDEGILVDTADNGREAVEAATRTHYDAILMDVSMPELDGLEATRSIRSWETEAHGSQGDIPRVPIIGTTAHAMKKDLKPCVEAGMDDYLTKPFESWQLFETLGKWLRRESGTGANEKGYEKA